MRPLRSNASGRGERSETQGMHDYVILNGARAHCHSERSSSGVKNLKIGVRVSPDHPLLISPLKGGEGSRRRGMTVGAFRETPLRFCGGFRLPPE